jgi:hypothetical protein
MPVDGHIVMPEVLYFFVTSHGHIIGCEFTVELDYSYTGAYINSYHQLVTYLRNRTAPFTHPLGDLLRTSVTVFCCYHLVCFSY